VDGEPEEAAQREIPSPGGLTFYCPMDRARAGNWHTQSIPWWHFRFAFGLTGSAYSGFPFTLMNCFLTILVLKSNGPIEGP
jgi:hypothetical protein